MGGKISIDVDKYTGKASVGVHVDSPNIDVDIPWYCWVAGAVIGALLGGIFQSLIAVLIGAVLVPLIMFIAEQVIEGVVNTVAESIATALNNIAHPIPHRTVGFKLITQGSHIDDVQMVGQILSPSTPRSSAPPAPSSYPTARHSTSTAAEWVSATCQVATWRSWATG